ncbi:hypothetical protein ABIF78_007671 [Bradyrhizobium japonicum]
MAAAATRLLETETQTVELLLYGSLFLRTVTDEDIEYERQRIEAECDRRIEVYRVTQETRSGARCTRVEWRVV